MSVKTVIIDDSDFFRKYMTGLCQQIGQNVVDSLPSGDAFINGVRSGDYDDVELVLLDINMPGKTGKELIEDILEFLPDILVIMVSTLSSIGVVEECLDLGAANFINKDSKSDTMMHIIKSTLQMNGFEED